MAAGASSSTKQMYEYLLFGSIPESQLNGLLHRLRGLCDHNNLIHFKDREIVFGLKSGSSVVKLRARHSVDESGGGQAIWHLIYSGQLEASGDNRLTAIRTLVVVPCSSSLIHFLVEMGFHPHTEILIKGYIFKKGRLKVSINKLFLIPESGELEKSESYSDNYLIELSAVGPSGQDNIAAEMKAFAEQLKPLVTLEKMDGATVK